MAKYCGVGVKKSKADQTQFKAKQSQFALREKMIVSSFVKSKYEELPALGGRKNRANSNPTCSELVEPNSNAVAAT